MRSAKAAAQEAVDTAKGNFSKAAHDRKMAELVHGKQESLARGQTARIDEAAKGITPVEKTLAEKQKAAESAKSRLLGEKAKSQSDIEKINEQESKRMTGEQTGKNKAIKDLSTAVMDIKRGKNPAEVAKNTETAAKYLYDNGHITLTQREELMQAARDLKGTIEQRNEAIKRLTKIGIGVGAAVGLGYTGRHAMSGLFNL